MNLNLNSLSSQATPLLEYIQKKRENQKIVKSVEIGATFFLISFFVLFAIKPTFLTISALIGDINSKKLLSTQLKTKINDVIVAQDLFSQVQERYSLVESSLPLNPRFYHANSQIISLANNRQISFPKINYVIKDQNYFTTNLNASTSYQSAVALFSDLLQNRRLINIDGITFSVNEDQPGQINIVLPLKVYFWKPDVKK